MPENENCLWYFTCFVEDRVIHVQHSFINSGVAERQAQSMFDLGVNINGMNVEITRVCAISEHHEIALDIRRSVDKW